jgi:hypothetical protein
MFVGWMMLTMPIRTKSSVSLKRYKTRCFRKRNNMTQDLPYSTQALSNILNHTVFHHVLPKVFGFLLFWGGQVFFKRTNKCLILSAQPLFVREFFVRSAWSIYILMYDSNNVLHDIIIYKIIYYYYLIMIIIILNNSIK